MTIAEAEEYISEHFDDTEEFILENDDDHAIVLYRPGYEIPEHNLICYEGYWYDKAEDQADFSLTAVFKDNECVYWEQDCIEVTLHNFFRQTGVEVDVYSLCCDLERVSEVHVV